MEFSQNPCPSTFSVFIKLANQLTDGHEAYRSVTIPMIHGKPGGFDRTCTPVIWVSTSTLSINSGHVLINIIFFS